MKATVKIVLTLMALVPMAVILLVVRPWTKDDPAIKTPAAVGTSAKDVVGAAGGAPVATVPRGPGARPISPNRPIARVSAPAAVELPIAVEAPAAVNTARLGELENGVALRDIPDALRYLHSLSDTPAIRELTVALIRQWAESDAPSAAMWAEGMPVGGARQEALNGVAIVWSNQELEGSIQWALQLKNVDEMNEVLRYVAYEAARAEPLEALSIAAILPVNSERDALVQHAVLQWAAILPADAALWANEIPDPALRERVMALIATAWGESDPLSAAQFAVQELPTGRAQDDAVIGIIQRWTQSDPVAAADWVLMFPESDLAETAVENVNQLWPGEPP